MSTQANEINGISFGVVEYFAIGLTLADCVLDVAPKMRVWRNSLLQTIRCRVIGPFSPEWIPGDLRFI